MIDLVKDRTRLAITGLLIKVCVLSCMSHFLTRLTNCQDEDLRALEVIDHDVWKEMRKRRNRRKDLGDEATAHDNDRVKQSEAEVDVVGWLLINYEIAITNKEGGKTPRLAEATNNWNDINFRWNDMRPPIRDKLDKSYEKLMKLLNITDGRHDFGGKSNDNDL
jgi:hypothetical protein